MAQVDPNLGWQPVYSFTEKLTAAGLHSRGIQKLIITLLQQLQVQQLPETLPATLLNELQLLNNRSAISAIHNPSDVQLAQKARARFKLEELLHLQLELLLRKQISMNAQQDMSCRKLEMLSIIFIFQ